MEEHRLRKYPSAVNWLPFLARNPKNTRRKGLHRGMLSSTGSPPSKPNWRYWGSLSRKPSWKTNVLNHQPCHLWDRVYYNLHHSEWTWSWGGYQSVLLALIYVQVYLDCHIHLIIGREEWVKRGSFMSNDVLKHGCKTDEFPYLSILFYIKLFEYPPSNIIKHPISFSH